MSVTLALLLLTILSLVNFAQSNNQSKKPDPKIIAEVEAFENELVSALRKGDQAPLEKMIADGFVFIHSTGGIETRDEYLKNAGAGNLLLQRTEFENSEKTWNIYGGNTAIRYQRTVMRNKSAGTENRMRNIAVFVKTDGRWQWASGQSTKLPVRPKATSIDSGIVDGYTGQYQISDQRNFTVIKENGALFGLVQGRSKAELVPTSENVFVWFNENNDVGFVEVIFVRGEDGKVSECFLRQNGQETWRAKRIK